MTEWSGAVRAGKCTDALRLINPKKEEWTVDHTLRWREFPSSEGFHDGVQCQEDHFMGRAT